MRIIGIIIAVIGVVAFVLCWSSGWNSEVVTIVATIVTIVGLVVFGVDLVLRKRAKTSELEEEKNNEEKEIYARRYLDQAHQLRFLKSLPKQKKAIYEVAQEGWNTGVTVDMMQSNSDVIDFLKETWIKLAEFYPPHHFDGKQPGEYISDYIKRMSSYYRASEEPTGAGTGGTIVGVLTGANIIDDLENMIIGLIRNISNYSNSIDYDSWITQWKNIEEQNYNCLRNDELFVSEFWPEEGIPVFKSNTTLLILHTFPSRGSPVVKEEDAQVGKEIKYNAFRYRTLIPGRAVAKKDGRLSGMNLGAINYISKDYYYNAYYHSQNITYKKDEEIEYLQYRAEGSCFIRRNGDVYLIDYCPWLAKHDEILMIQEPLTELWIHVISENGEPLGWLLKQNNVINKDRVF